MPVSKLPQAEPVIMWEQRDKKYPSLTARCSYARPHLTVVVLHDSGRRKSDSHLHTFEPLFGQNTRQERHYYLPDLKLWLN
jgi:hypothetical protein